MQFLLFSEKTCNNCYQYASQKRVNKACNVFDHLLLWVGINSTSNHSLSLKFSQGRMVLIETECTLAGYMQSFNITLLNTNPSLIKLLPLLVQWDRECPRTAIRCHINTVSKLFNLSQHIQKEQLAKSKGWNGIWLLFIWDLLQLPLKQYFHWVCIWSDFKSHAVNPSQFSS